MRRPEQPINKILRLFFMSVIHTFCDSKSQKMTIHYYSTLHVGFTSRPMQVKFDKCYKEKLTRLLVFKAAQNILQMT